MSTRLAVLAAVKALLAGALPLARVEGLTADSAKPDRIPAGGLVVVREGDPGPATIDLSPLAYNYEHAIPVEVTAPAAPGIEPAVALDTMLAAIGTAIAANRTLGGLVFWLDAEAPPVDDVTTEGAAAFGGANLVVTASYVTTNPLS